MQRFLINRSGQSLTEVLVATTITAFLVVAAVALIAPVLRNDQFAGKVATNGALGRELLDNVKSFAEANWFNIANLSTSSAVHFHLTTTTSPFALRNNDEVIIISSTTYTRYFTVSEVYRYPAPLQEIATTTSGTVYDPATRIIKITIISSNGPSSTVSRVLTRSQNVSYIQSDWSGGASSTLPATASTTNQYILSSNIDATSTPGSIQLDTL
ncbi:MAG: hypothetical protein AAB691_01820 [Patescibacteria group bacterium]